MSLPRVECAVPEGSRKARVSLPPSLIGYTLSATLSVTQNSARSRLVLFPFLKPTERRTRVLVDLKHGYCVKDFEEGVDILYDVLRVMRAKMPQ